MEFTTLGRTGLRVSRMGLGCGGHSRLGTRYGNSDTEAETVVREALNLGVNFFDTAESYGTEEIVGRALAGVDRSTLVISTKAGVDWEDRRTTPAEYRDRVDASLRRLRTDYIDVFHVHGVTPDEYGFAIAVLVPVLRDLQAAGKIRNVGITEAFGSDPAHNMLVTAEGDDCWDVMMVGFNVLNQSARERVFPWTRSRSIGTLGMFAVRRALSNPDQVRPVVQSLVDAGTVTVGDLDLQNPLGFAVEQSGSANLSEMAYRYARWEPGIDVVLSGTGSIQHLRDNAKSLSMPALPTAVSERLAQVFATVDTVAGN